MSAHFFANLMGLGGEEAREFGWESSIVPCAVGSQGTLVIREARI